MGPATARRTLQSPRPILTLLDIAMLSGDIEASSQLFAMGCKCSTPDVDDSETWNASQVAVNDWGEQFVISGNVANGCIHSECNEVGVQHDAPEQASRHECTQLLNASVKTLLEAGNYSNNTEHGKMCTLQASARTC